METKDLKTLYMANLKAAKEKLGKSVSKMALDMNMSQEQRQGCCSHHLGVCGCDKRTGHQLCCDGALSPSCMCRL